MTIIDQLATSLNRRDEVPNQELANQIVSKNDKKAVAELVNNLNNKSKAIQSDCIKVLYEIGEQKPAFISAYTKNFIELLDNENNRLQWGVMTAIDATTTENPALVYAALSKILIVAKSGSVITRDHAVNILIKLCAFKQYAAEVFPLLIKQLKSSPVNQLAMYAERMMPVINEKSKAVFIKTLNSRFGDIEKDSQRKRIEKLIKKLGGDSY